MGDTIATVAAIALIFVGLPVLILWRRDRRTSIRRQHLTRQLSNEREADEKRILSPDWEAVESFLQRPVPSMLRELYADHTLVTAYGLRYRKNELISTFAPLDYQGVFGASPLGFDALIVATTDFGDPVYLRAGQTESDTVYVTHHDGSDTEVFAASIAEMLAVLRERRRTP